MNTQNKYGFTIGQQVGDMIITDMYRNSSGHLHLVMKCPICGFEKTLRYNRITKIVNHDVHSKPISVKDQYPIGTTINDMTVIDYGISANGCTSMICKCNICGKVKEIQSSNIKHKIGSTYHTYCNLPKYNDYNGLSERHKRLYRIWKGMNERIYNPNRSSYFRYGGRGLTCDYNNFEDFLNEYGDSYYSHVAIYGEDNTTIDRINNNLGYVKGNLRWATKTEQARNRECMKKYFLAYSPNGEIYLSNNQQVFSRNHNIEGTGIYSCLNGIIKTTSGGWQFYPADNLLFLPPNVIYELYY